MGARQSKRSVDIAQGKEGETVGEVAGAEGAAGEGRLERIEDADAAVTAPLKPQLNGDAPHTETIQISDKEKKLQEISTPENEKDNTTEKEINEKEEKDKEIILSSVNGSGDELDKEAAENGDAKVAEAENNKKNKKVKKKWSLRSISFSKKDKQKPDKPDKQKKDETNGECDKVPEESAEATVPKAEVPEIKTPEETETKESPKVEEKQEKTPETPVTEPITNGSSTPETPKEDAAPMPVVDAVPIPVVDAAPTPVVIAAPETKIEVQKVETAAPESDKLPIENLKIVDAVEPKADDVAAPGEAIVTTPESDTPLSEVAAVAAPMPAAPAPVTSEVCVAASSVEDAVPPPLPVNPPPSSLTAFATTTMAPHLVTAIAHDPPHSPHSPHTPHSPHPPQPSPAPIPEELEISEQDKEVAESPIESALSESVVTSDVTTSDEATKVEPIVLEVESIAAAIPTEEVASPVEILTTDELASTVEVTPNLDEAPIEMVAPTEDAHMADIAPSDESAQIIETHPVPNVLESKGIEIIAEIVSVPVSPVCELVTPETHIEKEEIQSTFTKPDSEQIQYDKTVDAAVEDVSINSAVVSGQSLPTESFSDNPISDLPEPLSEPAQSTQKDAVDNNEAEPLKNSQIESSEIDYKVKDAEPSEVEVEAIKVVSDILESVSATTAATITATPPVDKVEKVLPTLDSCPSPNGRQSPTEVQDCQQTLEEPTKVAEIVSEKISEVSVEAPAPVSIPEMTNGDTDTTSGDAGTTE